MTLLSNSGNSYIKISKSGFGLYYSGKYNDWQKETEPRRYKKHSVSEVDYSFSEKRFTVESLPEEGGIKINRVIFDFFANNVIIKIYVRRAAPDLVLCAGNDIVIFYR